MTPPRMSDRGSDDIVNVTPAYPPDPDNESDDIVDMTPQDSPEDETDEFMSMIPSDSPEDGETDEFMSMIPSYGPEYRGPSDSSRMSAADRRQNEYRTAEGGRPTQTKPGGRLRKYVITALVGIAVLLFVVNRVLGYSIHLGPINLAGANTGGSQPTPAATTPTPQTVQIGNGRSPTAIGPLILLNPNVVRQGTQVTVTGSGFDPGAVVNLTITRQGSTKPLASSFVQADKGGTFTGATVNVPTSLGSGNFLVVANQRNSKLSAQAVGQVAGGAPTVKLGTQVGQPGTMIVLSLHGFAPEETVNVYWNAMSGQPLGTLQADGGGSVGQAQLQVPIGAVGQNTFLFVGAKSQSVVAANFLVLKLYPTVKPSSYALRADNLISFSGVGFGPGERVFVFLNSAVGQPLGVVSADSHGAFKNAAGFTIPFQLKGKQTLVFMGEQSHATSTISFTVMPYSPVITPSTYGGTPGTTLTFFVTGFARNEVVHVYTGGNKNATGTMVGCFQTDSRGSAAAVGSYLIPGSAQGQVGFTLVGEKSGGVGVATVKISAPPVPVQTPPQAPFTCPLDQPGQQPQQQQPGAPQQPDQNQQQQQPDQNQQNQNQNQQQQPDQNQQNQNQQNQNQNQPQGNVARPDRQIALGAAPYLLAFAPFAVGTATAASASPARAPLRAAAQMSGGRAAQNRSAYDAHRASRISTIVIGQPGQPPISPALAGLGMLWIVLVATLTAIVVRRSSREEVKRSAHAENDHTPHTPADMPTAALAAASSACPKTSESGGDRALAPQLAARPPTKIGEDDAPRQLPTPAGKYRLDDITCLASARSGFEDTGSTAHAAWQTATHHGDGRPACHDTTLVQTNLTRAGAVQAAFALFLLADGRSNSPACSGASRVAVESIARRVIRAMSSGAGVPSHLIMPMFKYAVILADGALLARNETKRTDMTTTVTGAMLVGRHVYVVNVGDSRTYLCSPKGGLWQLTKDHSVAFGLVSAGFLRPEALDVSRPVRRLYRSLGDAEHPIQVDTFEMAVSPGDWLLLCSDGLWRHVRDPQIETTLRTTSDPVVATQRLIRQATEVGCDDDATAIVVRIPANTPP